MNLTRRNFLAGCIGTAAALNLHAGQSAPRRRNLVFILGDDHRADLLGCAGHPILKTPNLDQIAREGVRFSNACVTTAICCTSRASILTGMQVRRHKVENFTTPIRNEDWVCSYPALLRQQGYRTGFFGKFGVGSDEAPAALFDEVLAPAYRGAYFDPTNPKSPHVDELHCAAVESFIARYAGQNQPFCVSLSFRSPHAADYAPMPYPAAPEFESLYQDVRIPTPEEIGAPSFDVLPEFLRDSEGRRRFMHNFGSPERYQDSVRNYFRMISGVDAYIGRIRRQLEKAGIADHTVIIYLGDNGYFLGERGLEGKWYAYEQSIRVPLLIYDPQLPAAQRGRVVQQLVHETDISPTLLNYAGISIPERVQGRSLRPLLQQEARDWRTGYFYQHLFQHPHIPRSEGVIDGDWKYIRWLDGAPGMEELYHLPEDRWECHNLAEKSEHSTRLAKYRAMREHYLATLA